MKAVVGVMLATVVLLTAVVTQAAASPQGPWQLPAADLSAPGGDAIEPEEPVPVNPAPPAS